MVPIHYKSQNQNKKVLLHTARGVASTHCADRGAPTCWGGEDLPWIWVPTLDPWMEGCAYLRRERGTYPGWGDLPWIGVPFIKVGPPIDLKVSNTAPPPPPLAGRSVPSTLLLPHHRLEGNYPISQKVGTQPQDVNRQTPIKKVTALSFGCGWQ